MTDIASTTRALQESWSTARYERDLVTASGEGAAEYLHGQVSQNIADLAVGEATWSFVLSPQGRIDAWTRVTRVADQLFWLDLDAGFGQQLLDRLERFKLRTKVEFVLATVTMISVRGPQSPEPTLSGPDIADLGLAWEGDRGFDRVGVGAEAPEHAIDGSPEAFEAQRIRLGRPRMGSEILEKTIPAELGVVERSVDFSKGCYVGQELVARVDSRGNNTPRSLWGVTVEQGVPVVGESVVVGGETVGSITSVARAGSGAVALASIVRAAAVPGAATVAGSPALVGELPMTD